MQVRVQLLGLLAALACAGCDTLWGYVAAEGSAPDLQPRPDARPSTDRDTADLRPPGGDGFGQATDLALPDLAPRDLPPPAPDGAALDASPCSVEAQSCVAAGKAGVCHAGQCCTGCWDLGSSTCFSGAEAERCGSSGDACNVCLAKPGPSKAPCLIPTCSGGQCGQAPAPDETSCTPSDGTLGRCFFGTCYGCKGCWSNAACEPGDDSAACGVGGLDCVDCGGKTCWAGVCEK